MQCVAFPSPDPTGCTPASVVLLLRNSGKQTWKDKKNAREQMVELLGRGESNLDISTFEGDQLLLISPAVEQRPG